MSQPQPPQPQRSPETERYLKTARNIALFTLVASPLVALLPPRKFDAYTVCLVGLTGFSADYLIKDHTGKTIWQHISRQEQQAVVRQEQKAFARHGERESELQKETRSVVADMRRDREAWKAQRRREIQEDVEEGKGFADMIMDQIWEVWNQGKVKKEDEE